MNNSLSDSEEARNVLEQCAIELEDGVTDNRLAAIGKDAERFWAENTIVQLSRPVSWRIVKLHAEGEQPEEVAFTIRGVIHSKDLPPLNVKPRILPNRFRYLKQSVTLSGLGSSTFGRAMSSMQMLHQAFDRHFAEDVLEPISASENEGDPSIDLSNRYFTPKADCGGMQPVPFQSGVDPKGILRHLATADPTCAYVHTEENIVRYYEVHRSNDGISRYHPCEPQRFRIGDIVQAQVSFVVIPIRGEKRKMLSVLRSLALIDGRFGQKDKRSYDHTASGPRLVHLKRRIGYGNSNDHEGIKEGESSGSKEKKRMFHSGMEVDDENRTASELD